MEKQTPIVVVKVGGSLLSLPDLARRLAVILRGVPDSRLLIVSGGGEAADVVRRWQSSHAITDEQAHWLALRAVSLNELLLSELLQDAVVVPSRDALSAAWSAGKLPILAADAFIRAEESHATEPLPHDWSATSDSIAVWVAQQLGAVRVVLCKSCTIEPEITLDDAAARTMVDSHFPVCAAGLAIDWVNLRADVPRLIRWTRGPQCPRSGSAALA